MEEIADYERICKALVVENEELRRKLSGARPHIGELAKHARDFIEDNYLVILAALFITSTIVSGLYTLYQDRKRP